MEVDGADVAGVSSPVAATAACDQMAIDSDVPLVTTTRSGIAALINIDEVSAIYRLLVNECAHEGVHNSFVHALEALTGDLQSGFQRPHLVCMYMYVRMYVSHARARV
jgi:hypothetical protein